MHLLERLFETVQLASKLCGGLLLFCALHFLPRGFGHHRALALNLDCFTHVTLWLLWHHAIVSRTILPGYISFSWLDMPFSLSRDRLPVHLYIHVYSCDLVNRTKLHWGVQCLLDNCHRDENAHAKYTYYPL